MRKTQVRQRYRKKKKQVKSGIILFLLVFLFCMICFDVFVYGAKEDAEQKKTNEDAVLYTIEEQKAVLREFEELNQLAFAEDSKMSCGGIIIPGLRTTKTLAMFTENEISTCTSMTPQGLCIAEKYLLISAYCHKKEHHSVIYVLDRYTHSFLKEIVLDGNEHVGGLAYDQDHQKIWVSTYKDGKATASGFSIKSMNVYDLEVSKKAIGYEQEYVLSDLKRNSFMTYQDGYLYVGCFSVKDHSIVKKYRIFEEGELKNTDERKKGISKEICVAIEKKKLPKQTQGIAFGRNVMFLSKSYGIANSELIICRSSTKNNDEIIRIMMPPKMEQVCFDGKVLYVLFESAAYPYRLQPVPKVDRVLILNIEKYLEEG